MRNVHLTPLNGLVDPMCRFPVLSRALSSCVATPSRPEPLGAAAVIPAGGGGDWGAERSGKRTRAHVASRAGSAAAGLAPARQADPGGAPGRRSWP
jgi:hypothetical protein